MWDHVGRDLSLFIFFGFFDWGTASLGIFKQLEHLQQIQHLKAPACGLGDSEMFMATFLRFGMLVDVGKIGAESGHPYSMTSAYTPDPNEFSFTLRGAAGHCHMLDQIWFDSTRSHCQAGSV